MQLLQTELSDSKEKIEQLESVVEKLEAQLQKYQVILKQFSKY